MLKLQRDLFTDLQKTPWAGVKIGEKIKTEYAGRRIGESWEVSCDPKFPSKIAGTEELLKDRIAADPEKYLGTSGVEVAAAGRAEPVERNCEILLKYLNASKPLSVQIHPDDHDPNLAEDESGKPESWYILEADPGAGLYLGFRPGLSKEQLRRLLEERADLTDYLQFVPVKSGEFYDLAPGVPHAVGPGVLLIEPQRILPGKSGKTYRFWDWNRRYNASGEEDPEGEPRPTHIEESLAILDLEKTSGPDFIQKIKIEPKIVQGDGFTLKIYDQNPYYKSYVLDIYQGASVGSVPTFSIEPSSYFTMLCFKGSFQGGRQGDAFFGFTNTDLCLERGQGAAFFLNCPAYSDIIIQKK